MGQSTNQDTNAKYRSLGGYSRRVVDPANPASISNSTFHGVNHSALVPVIHGTANYKIYLPDGAFIKSITVSLATAFSAGATMNVGTTQGGVDISSGIDITVQSFTILNSPSLSSPLSRNSIQNVRPLFFSIVGSPAAGVGSVIVEYFDTK